MKTKQRPTRVKERQAKQPEILPARFTPGFLEDMDGRQTVVRELREYVQLFSREANADTMAKRILVELAAFMHVRFRMKVIQFIETGELDEGVLTQQINSLSGLLSKLGLNHRAKELEKDLHSYIKEKYEDEDSDDEEDD